MLTATTFTRPTPSAAQATLLLREAWSTRDPSRWPEAPEGGGRPAMLVPGFLAGDSSLSRMARWLRDGGWATTRAGVRVNVDCTERSVKALEARLAEAVRATGQRALVVGQSRGGTFGRILAVRRPDLIESLVTLGSPVLDQHATSRPTSILVTAIATLGTAGVPRFFSRSCRDGGCCELARADLGRAVSDQVRYIAFYSREDERSELGGLPRPEPLSSSRCKPPTRAWE